MGVSDEVGFHRFPAQGSDLGRRAEVCFDYDARNTILGTVVRDDAGPPHLTIIRLDDGRHVLTTECHWRPL